MALELNEDEELADTVPEALLDGDVEEEGLPLEVTEGLFDGDGLDDVDAVGVREGEEDWLAVAVGLDVGV